MPIWTTFVGWWHLHFLLAVDLLDVCIFSFIEMMISEHEYVWATAFLVTFLLNLSQTPSRHTTSYDIVRRLIDVETTSYVYCRSGAIIFIVLQDLWNYIQFNLLVAIL